MGEARKEALRVDFDSHIKLEFHGASVTSDAGLVAYRELDEALGLTMVADDIVRDPRRGKNTQHELTAMLRQAECSRLAGYEDTNDAGPGRGPLGPLEVPNGPSSPLRRERISEK